MRELERQNYPLTQNTPGANIPGVDGESWEGNILELAETGTDKRGTPYRRLDIVIDSGAFRSVIPPEVALHYPTEPVPENEQPRARTATGEEVHVLGKRPYHVISTTDQLRPFPSS